MEYEIVIGSNAYDLMCNVMGFCNNGWKPLGGVQIVNDFVNGGYQFYQSVVRKTQDNAES